MGWNISTSFSYNVCMKSILKRFAVPQWIVIVLAVVIDIFIIVNACLPSGPSTQESNWVVEPAKNIINTFKANTINDSNIKVFSSFIRKFVGHFSLFLLSGILTTLSIKFIYYNQERKFARFMIISCISGLFLAILTEFIQLFVPGRSGEIFDVLIDFSGYIIPTLIIFMVTYFLSLKTPKEEIAVE